mmetsp:Transcript_1938/g.3970  ORF Transcript_1938/g.3970 Transcript_1938/m.3970 type:complete len:122 (-) Transcript_1938:241-606(-)
MMTWCCKRDEKNKDLCGVGITFETSSEGVMVVQSLVPGSPAENCGLIAAGDALYEVDGRSFYRSPAVDVAKAVLGAEGTSVSIGLKRGLRYESDPLFYVSLVRRPIQGAGSVQAALRPGGV